MVKYFEKQIQSLTTDEIHTVYCKAVKIGDSWRVHIVHSDKNPYLYTVEVTEDFFEDTSEIQRSFYNNSLQFLKDYFG